MLHGVDTFQSLTRIMQKIGLIVMVLVFGCLMVLIQSNGVEGVDNLPASQMLDAKTLLNRRKRYIFFTPGSAVQVN